MENRVDSGEIGTLGPPSILDDGPQSRLSRTRQVAARIKSAVEPDHVVPDRRQERDEEMTDIAVAAGDQDAYGSCFCNSRSKPATRRAIAHPPW